MNLLRLVDSPLLLDGFEEFVCKWLGNPEPQTVPDADNGLKQWLNAFPSVVTDYWKMAYRWPDACLDGSQDDFAGTSSWPWSRELGEDKFATLVTEAQNVWSIDWQWEQQELWVRGMTDEDSQRLPSSLPRMLVTFGLYSIAMAFWAEDPNDGEAIWLDQERIPDEIANRGQRIWSGCYHDPDHEYEWWFIESLKVLWYTCREVTIFAAKDEQACDWLVEQLKQ